MTALTVIAAAWAVLEWAIILGIHQDNKDNKGNKR